MNFKVSKSKTTGPGPQAYTTVVLESNNYKSQYLLSICCIVSSQIISFNLGIKYYHYPDGTDDKNQGLKRLSNFPTGRDVG